MHALAALVVGTAVTAQPLAAFDPAAAPACTLYPSPEVLLLALPAAGSAQWGFAVPADPAFVGVTFVAQTLVAEFGAGALQTLSASNALTLSLGAF
jgi:hypothetical protein